MKEYKFGTRIRVPLTPEQQLNWYELKKIRKRVVARRRKKYKQSQHKP